MASPEPSAGGDAASQSAAVQPLQLPTPEEIKGQEMMNNCAVRSVLSGVMALERLLFGRAPLSHHRLSVIPFSIGGGLGVLMGLFFGALENPIMSEEMTARQQIVYQAKQMGRKSMSHAKTFAVMGLIFSAAECVVEKARAKHDITNSAVAGCVTGGALAAKGGPQATCIGCVGFGAFSVAIEKFMERHT
ncbi:unnamed protein product [Triticum turgidum subsp. durum]|uniref:Mitochondrial import inner membrane translocase subunit TIM22 n=1 Tax=Triticum turgidum subsp. durum TaxID=4567 RepID=A0A9R0YIM7_TRITD|nr:unnamed protein product [Triticum turgidum subsp. durum]